VRRALDELLRRAPAPAAGSVAWDDYRMNVILNELLLQPDPGRRRELEAEFERFLAAGKQPDFVAFKQLERQPTRLDLLVPDNWKKYLFRHTSSRFGFRYYAKLLPALLLLGAGIALAPVKTKVCKGEPLSYQGRSLCVGSPADRLLYLEYLTRDAIAAQDHLRADSLIGEAGALARASVPVADTVPYYRNTAVRYYNYGVSAYNCARGGAGGCPPISADSLLGQACENFRRGEALYTAVAGTAGIEFFNARRLACPAASAGPSADTTTFTLRGLVLDAGDGKPLAGAQVRARTEIGRYAAQTDAGGRYALERVRPSARLVLEASAAGYERASLDLAVTMELPPLRLQPAFAVRSAAAWARALAADTPEAVSEYLRLFPDGAEAGEARKRLAGYAGARERADWDETLRANTLEAYNAHKRRYPGGAYTGEADTRIAALREVADYEAAVSQNTVAAYRSYLEKYPDGTRAGDARSRLNGLQAAGEEAQAWQSARTENTSAAYRRYLEAWPEGRHAAEAAQLIAGAGGAGDAVGQIEANMVRVRGGTFTMGCTGEQGGDCDDDEKPTHQVTVSDYYIGKYEVTQKEWRGVMGNSPSNFKNCDNCPVEQVSWADIQEFLSKLNAKTGKSYRLPTEAEWEYAARGGSSGRGYKYSGSNNLDEVAWYDGNSGSKTHPVGQKKANELGLYDMSGNVWEWCADWYGDYSSGAQTNPNGPSRASDRVTRGGSWHGDAQYCRVSLRNFNAPSGRYYTLGFRLAL
jgi:formylglycine-generating enzyme required for sulfatase activity